MAAANRRFVAAVVIAMMWSCGERDTRALEMVRAGPSNDILLQVRNEIARAILDHRRLIIYIGADWCEPCVRFRTAIASGELGTEFGDVRLLGFDDDRDRDALFSAGYEYRSIPTFWIPNFDGTAGPTHIEGGISDRKAVSELLPRLRAYLRGR